MRVTDFSYFDSSWKRDDTTDKNTILDLEVDLEKIGEEPSSSKGRAATVLTRTRITCCRYCSEPPSRICGTGDVVSDEFKAFFAPSTSLTGENI